eukprot:7171628-Pyramimonas_sp.AAC.1
MCATLGMPASDGGSPKPEAQLLCRQRVAVCAPHEGHLVRHLDARNGLQCMRVSQNCPLTAPA